MKKVTALLPILGVLWGFAFTPAMAQYTIWHSPLTFSVERNSGLTIKSWIPSTTIRVTTSVPGEGQWILLGLALPTNVRIDTVWVCYELKSSASFISQIRLTQTTTPDAAVIRHDDGTDVTLTGPECFGSIVGGLQPQGTITLALRLNFASTDDWIDIGGIGIVVSPLTTSVQQTERMANPKAFALKQNYPNPFNPQTAIEYDIQVPGKVELQIYNSLGQRVRTLVDEEKPPGFYRSIWDGRDNQGQRLTSGAYYYQLRAGDIVSAKRMILLK